MISKTTLNDSLLVSKFFIKVFCTTFRLDKNKNGDGIPLYIISHIPSIQLKKYTIKNLIETIFIETTI